MARSGIEETKALIQIENMSLKSVIGVAYGVRDSEFIGPGWLGTICFDIVAKPPAGYRREQLGPLLRNLLADRFKLAVHHDSKEASAYALIVEKGGPKFHEAAGPRGYFTSRPGLIEGTGVSMKEVAGALAGTLHRPVIDQTDFTSVYDVKLEWAPDRQPPFPAGENDHKRSPEPGPYISTALSEQLGLRLRARKVPIDIVIVDHVERLPTDN